MPPLNNNKYLFIYFLDHQPKNMGVKRQAEWASAINVALVGDAKVGKTSLVNRVTSDKFSEVRIAKLGHICLLVAKKFCN